MNYLDLLPDGVLIIDRNHTVVLANRVFLDFFELSSDDMIGNTCEVIHREGAAARSIPDFICPHASVVDKGEPERVTYKYTSRDGKERVFAATCLPVKDDRGDVVQVMQLLRDVTGTERSREEILREAYAHDIVGSLSEAYLRDGGMKVGLSLTVKKLNEFYKPDFIAILLPGDDGKTLVLESGEGWEEDFEAPIRAGSVEGYVYLKDKAIKTTDVTAEGYEVGEHLKRNGVRGGLWLPIPTEDSNVVVGVGGICFRDKVEVPASEIWVMEAILKDLSVYIKKEKILNQLKESRDFVSSILEGIGDGVVVIDRDFRIINANRGYLDQVKQSRGDIVGKHCYEISHHISMPCYLAGEECSVKQAFETGSSRRIIHTHFDKEGKPVYIETVSYPMKDSAGNVVSAIEVLTDVSDRVALENEVKKKMNELEDFYDMAIDRELKMKGLKEELEALKSRSGDPDEST
jgi:PAS domain S-box-containing protein